MIPQFVEFVIEPIGQVREPWQLYLANAVLAFGWAGTSLGIITNTLGLWFDKKRGMAISLALNGASFGGIVGTPLMIAAIGHFGFSRAMTVSAVVMVVLMVPVILLAVGRPPGLDDQTVTLRVRPSPGGSAHIGDVIAKRVRGEAARRLLAAADEVRDPLDIADQLRSRWSVEVEPPSGRHRAWTVTLEAPAVRT